MRSPCRHSAASPEQRRAHPHQALRPKAVVQRGGWRDVRWLRPAGGRFQDYQARREVKDLGGVELRPDIDRSLLESTRNLVITV